MNLESLKEVSFVDDDTEVVRQNIITTYEGITGRSLAPADPERLFLESLAVIIGQQKILINQTGKQNLLAYAENENLDHLGALVETERLPEQPAKTTMRFSLAQAHTEAITILQGTRVSPDGKLFFSTDEEYQIDVGNTSVDVPITCQTSGDIGNNYLPGQIIKLVDTIAFVKEVSNITTTSGGADQESDNAYRLRINEAPSRFSTAGPEAAYDYFVRSAHQDISDVTISSPNAGEVEICVLEKGGKVPTQEIKDAVNEMVSDKTVRPLTDKVSVIDPEVINYDLNVQYYIKASEISNVESVKSNIKTAKDNYLTWQKEKLGRDRSPDILIQMLITAGAKRVVINSPGHLKLTSTQISKETETAFEYMGYEDE
ncbi:MAG: baseplate J/gp47 family protein [Deltaproteobacteria bacterium]|nr:baseplate J/gp47 family protein [Deltaproteobacteria bacterium]